MAPTRSSAPSKRSRLNEFSTPTSKVEKDVAGRTSGSQSHDSPAMKPAVDSSASPSPPAEHGSPVHDDGVASQEQKEVTPSFTKETPSPLLRKCLTRSLPWRPNEQSQGKSNVGRSGKEKSLGPTGAVGVNFSTTVQSMYAKQMYWTFKWIEEFEDFVEGRFEIDEEEIAAFPEDIKDALQSILKSKSKFWSLSSLIFDIIKMFFDKGLAFQPSGPRPLDLQWPVILRADIEIWQQRMFESSDGTEVAPQALRHELLHHFEYIAGLKDDLIPSLDPANYPVTDSEAAGAAHLGTASSGSSPFDNPKQPLVRKVPGVIAELPSWETFYSSDVEEITKALSVVTLRDQQQNEVMHNGDERLKMISDNNRYLAIQYGEMKDKLHETFMEKEALRKILQESGVVHGKK